MTDNPRRHHSRHRGWPASLGSSALTWRGLFSRAARSCGVGKMHPVLGRLVDGVDAHLLIGPRTLSPSTPQGRFEGETGQTIFFAAQCSATSWRADPVDAPRAALQPSCGQAAAHLYSRSRPNQPGHHHLLERHDLRAGDRPSVAEARGCGGAELLHPPHQHRVYHVADALPALNSQGSDASVHP